MNKSEFLNALSDRLSGLPEREKEERLNFFIEMIDDRIEEGISEEAAVAELGGLDDIVSQILSEIPISSLVKEKVKKRRRFRTWEIVLLAIGSPLWLVLLIAAFVVLLSVYVVIWAADVSLWAIFGALVGFAVGGIAVGILFAACGHALSGIALIGASIACAGLYIFIFF